MNESDLHFFPYTTYKVRNLLTPFLSMPTHSLLPYNHYLIQKGKECEPPILL